MLQNKISYFNRTERQNGHLKAPLNTYIEFCKATSPLILPIYHYSRFLTIKAEKNASSKSGALFRVILLLFWMSICSGTRGRRETGTSPRLWEVFPSKDVRTHFHQPCQTFFFFSFFFFRYNLSPIQTKSTLE